MSENQSKIKKILKTIKKRFLEKPEEYIKEKIELKKINKDNDKFELDRKFLDLIEQNKNAYIDKIEEVKIDEGGGGREKMARSCAI